MPSFKKERSKEKEMRQMLKSLIDFFRFRNDSIKERINAMNKLLIFETNVYAQELTVRGAHPLIMRRQYRIIRHLKMRIDGYGNSNVEFSLDHVEFEISLDIEIAWFEIEEEAAYLATLGDNEGTFTEVEPKAEKSSGSLLKSEQVTGKTSKLDFQSRSSISKASYRRGPKQEAQGIAKSSSSSYSSDGDVNSDDFDSDSTLEGKKPIAKSSSTRSVQETQHTSNVMKAAQKTKKKTDAVSAKAALKRTWTTETSQTTLSAYEALIKAAPRESENYRELADFYFFLADKSTMKIQKKLLYGKAQKNYKRAVILNPLDNEAAQQYENISELLEQSNIHIAAKALPAQTLFKQPSSPLAPTPKKQLTPAQRAAIDVRKAELRGLNK